MLKKQQKLSRLISQGKLREAAQLLRPLCMQRPQDVTSWLSLASVYGQLKNYQGVLEACKQVARIQPTMPAPYSLMGNALACLGRFDEAGKHYAKALELQPNDPGILNNLGNALYLEGKLEEAADFLEQAIERRPDYADAYNNLANVYKALNDTSLAINHFQRALHYNPRLFEAHLNLADILIDRIGHPDAAEHHYRKAVEINPESIQARAGLANVHRYMGRLDEAFKVNREIQQLFPTEKKALANEADILERTGDHEAAFRLASTIAEREPPEPMAVDVLLRLCRHTDGDDRAIQLANRLVSDCSTSKTGREMLNFSLGRLFDKRGDYDTAFSHYKAANGIFDIPFDTQRFTHKVDRLIEAFSMSNMASLAVSGVDDPRPIFIIGMPRSGTSLTEQILASHPRVGAAGELNEVNDIVASLAYIADSTVEYPLGITRLTPSHLDRLGRRYLEKLAQHGADKARITDKMPHNFLNVGLIRLMLPGCKIIHCTRDPRDTCLSIYFQSFGWIHPYGTRLEWLGTYYRDYARLMEHWETVLEPSMLTVRYEELVEDQEKVTREILGYCDLEWDEACLNFHKSDRVVATASYDQVRQKLYTQSRARWKNYRNHIQPLIESLGETVDRRK